MKEASIFIPETFGLS